MGAASGGPNAGVAAAGGGAPGIPDWAKYTGTALLGAGLGAGLSGGQGQQVSPQIPEIYRRPVEKFLGDIMGGGFKTPSFTPTQAELDAVKFASSQFQPGGLIPGAQDLLSKTLAGNFLRPEANPFLQSTLDAMTRQYNVGLGRSLDQLTSTFGQFGQPTTSGALGTQGRLLSEEGLRGFNETMASTLYQNYARERGAQGQALQMAGLPFSLAQQAGALSALPRDLAIQEAQAQYMPLNALVALMGGTPVSYPAFAPSPFTQLLAALGQGAGGTASLLKALG